MQIRLNVAPRLHKDRNRIWAVLLFAAYLIQFLLEWSLVRFGVDHNGRWVASTVEEPEVWTQLVLLLAGLFSLVCTVGFLWTFRKRATSPLLDLRAFSSGVSGTDMLYTMAWLQVLLTVQIFMYGLFLPYPFFGEGTFGGLLESASLQLCILIVAAFLFRGRGRDIGFRRPTQWSGMLLTLFLVFGLIIFALDALVTTPLSNLLDYSLSSEREQGIEEEILQAKANDWLNGLFSIAITGIVVPIAEEILFRGVIQTSLVRKWGAFFGILVSSFWFAAVHVDIALFAPLFVIGLALGYMRHRFDSLWGAIFLHILNNTASVLYYFI